MNTLYFYYKKDLTNNKWKRAKIQLFDSINSNAHSIFWYDTNDEQMRGGIWLAYDKADFKSFEEMKRYISQAMKKLVNVRVYFSPEHVHLYYDERCFNINLVTSPNYHIIIEKMLEEIFGRNKDEYHFAKGDFNWDIYQRKYLIETYNRVELTPRNFLICTYSELLKTYDKQTSDKVNYFPMTREDYANLFSKLYQQHHIIVPDNVKINEDSGRVITETTARGAGITALPAIPNEIKVEDSKHLYHQCITNLRNDIKSKKNFNRFALLLAKYCKQFQITSKEFISDNQAIFKHDFKDTLSIEDRIQRFENTFQRARGNFVCKLILRYSKVDCSYCDMWKGTKDIFENNVIVQDDGTYISGNDGGMMRLSDFAIYPLYLLRGKQFNIDTGDIESITSYVAKVRDYRGLESKIIFNPQNFLSGQAFKKCLKGDYVFYGKDQHVVLLHQFIKHNTLETRRRLNIRGIHYEEDVYLDDDEDIHSIEDDIISENKGTPYFIDFKGAINQRNEYEQDIVFAGTNLPITYILDQTPFMDLKKSLQDSNFMDRFKALFIFNDPVVVAKILGWMFACFLKERFLKYRFPFLFVGGEPNAGKTATLSLLSRLFCYEEKYRAGFPAVANVSLPAMILSICSSNTLPLFYNEFKKAFLDKSKMPYATFTNLLRNMYDNGTYQRGEKTLTHIREWQLVSPLALMGERFLEETALKHRMEEVRMSIADRREINTANFHKLEQFPLEKLGKSLLLHGMNITKDTVDNFYWDNMEKVPMTLNERNRRNRAITLTGLDFFHHYLLSQNVLDFTDQVEMLKIMLLQSEDKDISLDKETTILMNRLLQMFGRMFSPDIKVHVNDFVFVHSEDDRFYDKADKLPENGRYIVVSTSSLLQNFVKDLNNERDKEAFSHYITEFHSLLKIIQGERYCIQFTKGKLGSSQKFVMILDADIMEKEGIDISPIKRYYTRRED